MCAPRKSGGSDARYTESDIFVAREKVMEIFDERQKEGVAMAKGGTPSIPCLKYDVCFIKLLKLVSYLG